MIILVKIKISYDIDELLKELHSIPESYSKVSNDLNKFYSNVTIEKIKLNSQKKVIPSILDEVCKLNEIDIEKAQKSKFDK